MISRKSLSACSSRARARTGRESSIRTRGPVATDATDDETFDHVGDRRTVDSGSHDEFRLAQTLFVCDDGENRILARGQIGARNLLGKDAIGALCSTVQQVNDRRGAASCTNLSTSLGI